MSSIRIHIERVIGLMKNGYTILQGTMSINLIKTTRDEAADNSQARIDKIVRLCGALANLGEGIVYTEDEIVQWTYKWLLKKTTITFCVNFIWNSTY